MEKFRMLRADEIDCRISTVTTSGLSLLLYKDARCDMNILDETVGPLNWQRCHSRENANCTVSIWDAEKKQWISKEDTGKESFTEAEKGLASDSFKRACFNWGIGRELYTAPFIWIPADKCSISGSGRKDRNNREIMTSKDRFRVDSIGYSDHVITSLSIYSISRNKIVYTFNSAKDGSGEKQQVESKRDKIQEICGNHGLEPEMICASNGYDWSNMTEMQLSNMIVSLEKKFGGK